MLDNTDLAAAKVPPAARWKWPTSAELATREDHVCLLELAPRQLGAPARETARYSVHKYASARGFSRAPCIWAILNRLIGGSSTDRRARASEAA